MARWNGSPNEELGGLLSLSEGVSGRFLSLPLRVKVSMGLLRTAGDADGEPEGNHMLVYGAMGMLRSACITCVNGAANGGFATGRPTNTRVRGAISLRNIRFGSLRLMNTHGSKRSLHCSPITFCSPPAAFVSASIIRGYCKNRLKMNLSTSVRASRPNGFPALIQSNNASHR